MLGIFFFFFFPFFFVFTYLDDHREAWMITERLSRRGEREGIGGEGEDEEEDGGEGQDRTESEGGNG